jgi:hypothetical protein
MGDDEAAKVKADSELENITNVSNSNLEEIMIKLGYENLTKYIKDNIGIGQDIFREV